MNYNEKPNGYDEMLPTVEGIVGRQGRGEEKSFAVASGRTIAIHYCFLIRSGSCLGTITIPCNKNKSLFLFT